ncbi:DUF4124 domain-containing protein [Moritella yayanosii]|uniref:Uncharacterized protein n=1 Tax=Moritella yayanosii TaxID=69539 RepID=A0A330LT70_9GAMM|nr:DUF4124 domain-containing protein [Moritella yayanosii]SQD80164.1 conserved exported protein of unknown function [Moritella yayanosii]
MMLNSKGNYKRLLCALVCGSMSLSTFAKVYSWRDADNAMHYSQFPRQIVEKNAAQSRASRKYADMNDVVNNLSPTKKVSNVLDGLDDIIANAHAERKIDKVLTRRDPQLVLIEQAAVLKPRKLKPELLTPVVASRLIATVSRKAQAPPYNAFLAGIKKKLNRHNATHIIADRVRFARQHKLLVEIPGTAPVAALVKSNTDINARRHRPSTVKNKALIQGAEQIKAIENAISSRSQSNKITAPSIKQVNSALMLSRLSYNHKARLPLLGAGTNQLARQGIAASSQFVNDVNRNAE